MSKLQTTSFSNFPYTKSSKAPKILLSQSKQQQMKPIKEVSQVFQDLGAPKFRIKQFLHAVFKEGKTDYNKIQVLPSDLKQKLIHALPVLSIKPILHVVSAKKDTEKALFEIDGGQKIEAVLLRYNDGRNSICISSQAGCQMGCKFCATGTMKFGRNLTAEEIFDQVFYFHIHLLKQGASISNIVYMGMGEPFMNYDNVLESVRMINNPDYLNLAARRITISTSGIVDGIKKLTDEPLQVNLALSLHAPTQAMRESIMPVARRWKLDELLDVINQYTSKTKRRVSFEYVMLNGINDQPETAEELAKISHGKLTHINIIPYNSTDIAGITGSEKNNIIKFKNILQKNGISVTVRVTMGQDIAAACGQLANKNKQKQDE